MLALGWLRAAAAAGKVKTGCVDATVRAAVLGAADKAAEVREAGVALAKQLLEVRAGNERSRNVVANGCLRCDESSRWVVIHRELNMNGQG